MEPIDVQILDRDYRLMVAPAERPKLLEAVHRVDDMMRRIRDSGRIAGVDRIAVMAALQLATEFIQLRDSDTGMPAAAVQRTEQRIHAITQRIESELHHAQSLG
jgi:cell division protein ZapA